ncbi:hypothetical protein [Marinifilum sp. D714]|uniref:hypothetical protein n=1 Tax=Marinifilum sp. D714 TaxID=2937523 RepID=UPI0027CEAC70|nr:hypothetical protein [Marinifilum sp. D714]MDQ2178000.1 hypothetical protein [Marinifilum sp. D714]
MKQTEEESINSLLIELGLVFYLGQSVESNLVILLGMAKKSGELKSDKSVRELMTMYFSRTMGSIKRSVSELVDINEDLEEILKVALDARNWLAHSFYREYAPSAFDENYRSKAKLVLNKAKEIFERTNELITKEIELQGAKCGLSHDKLDQMRIDGMQNYIACEKAPNEMWDESLNKTSWQSFEI